jgi:deoxyribodipyrimidine photo-lyase
VADRTIFWFRRDLRLADNPALLAAAADADSVVPLFVIDPVLWTQAGARRRGHLVASLESLDASVDGALLVRVGDPRRVVPELAGAIGARRVHAAFDFGPYGVRRDSAVAEALSQQEIAFDRLGSPYAVAPGRIRKADGEPYQVFTPFHRAWLDHGWRGPVDAPSDLRLDRPLLSDALGDLGVETGGAEGAGERAARHRWLAYLASEARQHYDELRDRPDLDQTSHLSVALKYGELHPRTVLGALGSSPSDEALRRQLAWRDFYADVLYRRPDTATGYYREELANQHYDNPDHGDRLGAWHRGETGYPFVDAGMRQLRATGWLPNRVRMVVASFLIKDLHLEWTLGAHWFMQQLTDGDLANNSHGWQWVAGTGTDAAPYHRIFNPVAQGLRFDPDGDYVRRHVPELRHLAGASAHEPWRVPDGYAQGYPQRLVDHGVERREALARYSAAKQQQTTPLR